MAVQPEHAAVVGGAGKGPNSRSIAKPKDSSRPSSPGGAEICKPAGVPVLSNPMGKASAAHIHAVDVTAQHSTAFASHRQYCEAQWGMQVLHARATIDDPVQHSKSKCSTHMVIVGSGQHSRVSAVCDLGDCSTALACAASPEFAVQQACKLQQKL